MDKPIVLITGVNGRVGKSILKRFGDHFLIIGIDNEPDHVHLENYYQVDITDNEAFERCMSTIKEKFGDKIESVIHLVAYYSFGDQDWKKYQEITIEGTRRLIRNLKTKFSVKQFIFSSTLLVYK